MPNLGIIASSISGNLWAPGKDYDSIATTTVSTAVSSITFSSIPQTYRHLQIRLSGNAGGNDTFFQLNGDTGTNYVRHFLYGSGSAAVASNTTSAVSGSAGYIASTANTNIFGASVFDLLDYANTSKYKTSRALSGYDANGSGLIVLYSSLWQNTAAVTSVTLLPYAGNFNQYTHAALYGVK